jgi:hypothetical protein
MKPTVFQTMEITDAKKRLWCGWESSSIVTVEGSVQPGTIDMDLLERKQYILHIRAYTSFYCSPNSYELALDNARYTMVRHLHKKLFGLTDEIRSAAHKGDGNKILDLCDKIEFEMGFR